MFNPTLERRRALDLRAHDRSADIVEVAVGPDDRAGRRDGPRTADILETLSNPTSRDILAVCMAAPHSVRSISGETGTPLATTYRHVNELQDRGLLYLERSAISEEGKRYDLYRAALQDVALEITSSGIDVRWTLQAAAEERLRSMWESLRL